VSALDAAPARTGSPVRTRVPAVVHARVEHHRSAPIDYRFGNGTTMWLVDTDAAMGQHYAHTLRLWRSRFLASWPQVNALGFDDTFRRMWEFYLAYCEAGFRAGYLDVAQIGLARPT
jgi:hypothetical protein